MFRYLGAVWVKLPHMNTTSTTAIPSSPDEELQFTSPSVPLNRLLDTVFRLGAEQSVPDLETAFFAPLREVAAQMSGDPFLPDPLPAAAQADPMELRTSFPGFDQLLDAAHRLGACKPGEGGHDLGMYFLFAMEEVLERMGVAYPDPEPTA